MKLLWKGALCAACCALGLGIVAVEAFTGPSPLSILGLVLLGASLWLLGDVRAQFQGMLEDVQEKKKA